MPSQTLPYAHLGDALATDYFHVREQFTDEQWEHFIASPDWTPRKVPRLPSPRCSSMFTRPRASGLIPGQP